MWRVAFAQNGRNASPATRTATRLEVDESRFATWHIINDSLDISFPLYLYLPTIPSACHHIIFSIHGRERNANKYRNIFVNHVQSDNIIIAAPSFKSGMFKKSTALTLGNMFSGTACKVPIPQEQWTFTIIDELFDVLQQTFSNLATYSLFGHSAGGQFAYRYALFARNPRVTNIVTANPGWYTMLDFDTRFPYGIGGQLSEEQLKAMLGKQLVILAGELDRDVDEKVRSTARVIAQGISRYDRAHTAIRSAHDTAQLLHTPCNWQLISVPDLGHSAKNAAPIALPYLMPAKHL